MGFAGRDRWDPLFDLYVGVLVIAALYWWLYRPVPLREESYTPVTGSAV